MCEYHTQLAYLLCATPMSAPWLLAYPGVKTSLSILQQSFQSYKDIQVIPFFAHSSIPILHTTAVSWPAWLRLCYKNTKRKTQPRLPLSCDTLLGAWKIQGIHGSQSLSNYCDREKEMQEEKCLSSSSSSPNCPYFQLFLFILFISMLSGFVVVLVVPVAIVVTT